MVRLTREVRFNLPLKSGPVVGGSGHAGTPAADGPSVRWSIRITLSGEPDSASGYLIDIKAIDHLVQERSLLWKEVSRGLPLPRVLQHFAEFLLPAHWPGPGLSVDRIELIASPQHSVALVPKELAVVELNHHFEFSAAHRLHNPGLSDEENHRLFGKCNNPQGHGHNYEVRVTIAGKPDAESGLLVSVGELEELVERHATSKVDHKHLNLQVTEFARLNPSVENIAKVIFDWLEPPLRRGHARLKSVTVWETPKTSAEYSGG